ncbi:uncharacterized protein CLUP02_18362 [Colletotrichum lupini]|uniref:Uncharacterized protein n=1 Tax=Colletotrichum lupini TaxID=145971 RepID=A0A9Q8SI04_9PEZI|nr:uncharacterized protein CLUP02_18362 [Colletotrichum lupini]UQC76847.1 hypothetical protein CLUP02_18362 [Colletotrichum lupini]
MGDFGMWLCVAAATQTTSSCSREPANQLASPLLVDRAAGALLTSNAFGRVSQPHGHVPDIRWNETSTQDPDSRQAGKYLWAGAGTFWWMATRPRIASAQVKFNLEPRGLILWRLRVQHHHDSANCTQHCPYGVKIDTTAIDAYQTYLNFTFGKYSEKSYGGPYPVILMPDASMCGFWTVETDSCVVTSISDLILLPYVDKGNGRRQLSHEEHQPPHHSWFARLCVASSRRW